MKKFSDICKLDYTIKSKLNHNHFFINYKWHQDVCSFGVFFFHRVLLFLNLNEQIDQMRHVFNINQIRYCDIMLVYAKISYKYIEVNEKNLTVSCFVILIFLFIFLFFVVLLKNFVFTKKMTF